jgi:hypothetical protein
MCAYGEWACFIEMHVFLCKILDLIRVVFILRFKLVIMGSRVITNIGRFGFIFFKRRFTSMF